MTEKDQAPSLAGRMLHGPAGFRATLERLGPTFMKLGQYLALRPDLIPQDYCDELMGLMDNVAPFPWTEGERIFQEDLGRDPDDVFEYLNPRPVAAGTFAQVHLARLKNGENLAVKIRRPGIEAAVERDLKRVGRWAAMLEMGGFSLFTSPRELAAEISDWMRQESNFKSELANLNRLRNSDGSSHQRIPQPHPDLCGPRIMTMEYLSGPPVSQILARQRARSGDGKGNGDGDGTVLGVSFDPGQFSKNLLRSVLNQVFRDRFFHGDLHPGNLIVQPDNAVGFVDFGFCHATDARVREQQMRFFSSVYANDVEGIISAICEILVSTDRADPAAFREDFGNMVREWMHRKDEDSEESANSRSPIADLMVEAMRAARRHGLELPTRILALYRTLLTAETVAHQLGGGTDLREVGNEFFESMALEESLAFFDPAAYQQSAIDMTRLIQKSPGQMQRLLADLSSGRFILKVETSEESATRDQRKRHVRLLTASILTVGLAVLLTSENLPSFSGYSLAWSISALMAFLYLWILVQWIGKPR